MANDSCTKCNSSSVEQTDDGNITCLDCGAVLEETDHLQAEVTIVTTGSGSRACGGVVSAISNGTSMATSVGRSVGNGPRPAAFLNRTLQAPAIRQIDLLGGKLGVSQPVIDRAKNIYLKLNQGEKYCRSPVLLAAAIVYIALREGNKPFTLYEFAAFLPHNDVFGMGRVFTRVLAANSKEIEEGTPALLSRLQDVDPSVYVERMCGKIEKISMEDKNKIRALTLRILVFTQSCWITTGRRHEAISIGAVSFAMETLGINRDSLATLCQLLKVSLNTAKARVRELKVLLLEKAKLLIPWASDYTERTIHRVLPKLLDQLEKLTKFMNNMEDTDLNESANNDQNNNNNNNVPVNSQSELRASTDKIGTKPDTSKGPNIATLPPSFITSMAARDRRGLKLAKAKRRLLATFENQPHLRKTLHPNLQASLAEFLKQEQAAPIPSPPPPASVEAFPLAPRYKPPTPPQTPPSALSPCTSSPSSPSTPSPSLSPLSPLSSPCSPSTPPASPAYFQPPPAHVLPKSRRSSKSKVSLPPPPVIEPTCDHEDLIIEKLLLKGVNEDLILSGYYDAQTAETVNPIVHPDISSEKVGEDDIPESEMDKFIRTPEEVKVFSQMASGWGEEDGNMDHKPIGKRRKRSYKAEDTSGAALLLIEGGPSSSASKGEEFQDLHKKPRMTN